MLHDFDDLINKLMKASIYNLQILIAYELSDDCLCLKVTSSALYKFIEFPASL